MRRTMGSMKVVHAAEFSIDPVNMASHVFIWQTFSLFWGEIYSCPCLCSNCFHCFFNFVSWIDLVQQPLKKDFRGSTLPLETFLPEFPLWCLHRWSLTLLAHLGSHVPLQKHAHWTFFWRISCFLKVQCVDKMHAFMKRLLRSNTLLHCHYWNSLKPYLMCSEAILHGYCKMWLGTLMNIPDQWTLAFNNSQRSNTTWLLFK